MGQRNAFLGHPLLRFILNQYFKYITVRKKTVGKVISFISNKEIFFVFSFKDSSTHLRRFVGHSIIKSERAWRCRNPFFWLLLVL